MRWSRLSIIHHFKPQFVRVEVGPTWSSGVSHPPAASYARQHSRPCPGSGQTLEPIVNRCSCISVGQVSGRPARTVTTVPTCGAGSAVDATGHAANTIAAISHRCARIRLWNTFDTAQRNTGCGIAGKHCTARDRPDSLEVRARRSFPAFQFLRPEPKSHAR